MAWQKISPGDGFFAGGDPYYQLRINGAPGGFAHYTSSEFRPALLRLNEPEDVEWLANRADAQVPEFYTRPNGRLRTRYCTALVNGAFLESLKGETPVSRITVLPPLKSGMRRVAGSGGPSSAATGAPGAAPASGDWLRTGTVVMGVIDFGIAFAQERFRHSRQDTRIEYFWVQDAPPARPAPTGATGALPYGRELSRADINQRLGRGAQSGFVDEDALYRRAAAELGDGWLRSVWGRTAHGTHVMDLACGYDLDPQDIEDREEKKRRPIVCVQLPEAATEDTSGESLDAYALDAIRYILDRADAIGGGAHLPVVINFSYGNVAGPHDGTSNLEAAIDDIVRKRRKLAPIEVVLPSGNSHLGRLHARIAFDAKAPDHADPIEAARAASGGTAPYLVDLRWRVLPDDRTSSFLEIWLPPPGDCEPDATPDGPPVGGSRIMLSITPPGQPRNTLWLDETAPGAGLRLEHGGEVLCEARYRYIREPTNRRMFLIALQPTVRNRPAPEAPGSPVAPSGTWTVTLVNTGFAKTDHVEAWIQRDDTPYGFPPRGRQSYFDQPCYVRFDAQGRPIESDGHPAQKESPCVVERDGSINALATGRETIVVGGSRGQEKRPAAYSAGGPISPAARCNTERAARPAEGGASGLREAAAPDIATPEAKTPYRLGPDALAVTEDSIVRRGVLAAGTRSGSVVALNGTSVAAPQIARIVADTLAESTSALGAGHGQYPQHADIVRKRIAGLARPPRPHRPDQPEPGPERVGRGLIEPPKGASGRRRLRVGIDRTEHWGPKAGARSRGVPGNRE